MADYYEYSFEKLEVWRIARQLKTEVYKLTQDFPKEELYGLTSQIRRVAGSVTANIAEGSGRAGRKDQAHFINVSYASGLELIDHLTTALDLQYLDKKEYVELRKQIDELLNKLNSYYRYLINQKEDLRGKFK